MQQGYQSSKLYKNYITHPGSGSYKEQPTIDGLTMLNGS